MNDGNDDGKKKGKSGKAEEPEPVTDRRPPVETVPLRPLAEVLPPGAEGARAFEQLMHAALEAWGQRAGFKYIRGDGNGAATGGVPGFKGSVTFTFVPEPSQAHAWSTPLSFHDPYALDSRGPFLRDADHVVLLHASAPPPDSVVVRSIEKWATSHVHGPAEIEPLLRGCPALLARYYPEEAEGAIAGYDGLRYSDLETAVQNAAVTAHARLRMLGIPTHVLGERDHGTSLSLANIFVPLRLLEREHLDKEHTAAELLNNGSSCVILGDPGSGKTTLLLYLALVHAGGAKLADAEPRCQWPLYVPLRELVKARFTRPGLTIVDYLAERARERDQIQHAHPALFEAALRLGDAIVFFDGLDEVGSDVARKRVAEDVNAFRATYPRSPVWVTARKFGYTAKIALPKDRFRHFQIAPLDTAEADQLVERWYAAREPVPGDRDRLTRHLQQALACAPSVRRLSSNPLLLTLMALIHQTQKKLPSDRGELYDLCVQMLLKTWHEVKREHDEAHAAAPAHLRLRTQVQKDYLAHLAMHIQAKNQDAKDDETRGLIPRSEALEVIARRHLDLARRGRPDLEIGGAREEMDEFITHIADRTGLLIDRGGGVLCFIHLSFQEYLAAWVFTCGGTSAHEIFEQRIGQPAWEEVLLLRLYIVLNVQGAGGSAAFDQIVGSLMRGLQKNDRPAVWLTLARALRDNLEFRKPDQQAILERALAEWLEKPSFSGEWFDVLREITLFTDAAVPTLREVLTTASASRAPAAAIAVLHLATRLLGFPSESVSAVGSRADLPSLRPDLCAFFDCPSAAPLFEAASSADWTAMLESLEGARSYTATAEWMFDSTLPPAALTGATSWAWRRVLSDLAARTAFGASRSKLPEAGSFFTTGGTLCVAGWKHTVKTPYAGLRMPAKSPGPTPARISRLLCPDLALETTSITVLARSAPLQNGQVRWASAMLRRELAPFAAEDAVNPESVHALALTFVRSFGRDYVRSFGRDFVHAFSRDIVHALDRDFGSGFVRKFSPTLNGSFGRDFVRDFGPQLGRHFGRELTAELGRRFGRELTAELGWRIFRGAFLMLGHDFGVDPNAAPEVAASQWNRAMSDDNNFVQAIADPRLWVLLLLCSSTDVTLEDTASSALPRIAFENPSALPLVLADEWAALAALHLLCMCRDLALQFPTGAIADGTSDTWLSSNPFDVFPIAVAWGEHAEIFREQGLSLKGERGTLILAHAAYAACKAGFLGTSDAWQTMLAERDTSDPRIEAAYLLFQIASFQDTDGAVVAWKKLVQNPPPELRPMFEAARIIQPQAAAAPPSGTGTQPASSTQPTHPAQPAASTRAQNPSSPPETPLMPAWFEIAPFPWHDPRAPKLRDCLVDAYAGIGTIRIAAQMAGIKLGRWESGGGTEAAWNSLLQQAASQGKVRALLDKMLGDPNIAAFHPHLRASMEAHAASPSTATAQQAAITTDKPSSPHILAPVPLPPPPRPTPREEPLFSWLHLSDIHFGQGNAARGWNQDLVLDALARDTAKLFRDKLTPAPQAIFVTGDIAFSGKAAQYENAAAWLEKVADSVGLTKDRVYLVAGNHDVDRDADKDRATKRLVRALREGDDDLDDALKDMSDREILAKRMAAYLDFTKGLGSPADLHWSLAKDLDGGSVKLIGLNTALLAADLEDRGKLRLGNEQLALLRDTREDQLTLVLTHHPFAEGWLRDERDARAWVEQRADIHLCGHVHDADALARRTAGGTGIVTVVAGAAHGDKQPDSIPETHGYNWGAVFRDANDKPVLRIWPRVWNKRMDFRLDVSHVPDGKLFAEHDLPRLRLQARRG